MLNYRASPFSRLRNGSGKTCRRRGLIAICIRVLDTPFARLLARKAPSRGTEGGGREKGHTRDEGNPSRYTARLLLERTRTRQHIAFVRSSRSNGPIEAKKNTVESPPFLFTTFPPREAAWDQLPRFRRNFQALARRENEPTTTAAATRATPRDVYCR